MLSVVFMLLVGLASYFKTDGIRAVLDSDKKIRAKTEELKKLDEQNAALRRKIESMQGGDYTVEKYAREKLFMAKKNETVFRFHEAPHDEGQTAEK
ncbi:MAG: septum formation initiator family protein [Nitrospinae bacterium]|nr:septum formation initiator family protein [Nitrospinota bacterium]